MDHRVNASVSTDTCYMSPTRDQQRFTVYGLAAVWHDLMVGALCRHPLNAITNNWICGATGRHTIASIRHRSSHSYSFPVPSKVGGWVGLCNWNDR